LSRTLQKADTNVAVNQKGKGRFLEFVGETTRATGRRAWKKVFGKTETVKKEWAPSQKEKREETRMQSDGE